MPYDKEAQIRKKYYERIDRQFQRMHDDELYRLQAEAGHHGNTDIMHEIMSMRVIARRIAQKSRKEAHTIRVRIAEEKEDVE